MPLTAKISFNFLWRLGLIAIICLGGCLYCLYDGAIGYPNQRQRALEYRKIEESGLKKSERLRKWEEIATKHGWPLDDPGEPKNEIAITWQFIMAGCVAVPGLLYLYLFLRSWRRWIELDEVGLRTSWGQRLEFGQIVALDKKKWKTKGIAVIRYEQDGRPRRLALDDWKYDVKATKAILCEVESRIGVDRIGGGPPEPLPGDEPQQRQHEEQGQK